MADQRVLHQQEVMEVQEGARMDGTQPRCISLISLLSSC